MGVAWRRGGDPAPMRPPEVAQAPPTCPVDAPDFQVDLRWMDPRVRMNGTDLQCVREFDVHQDPDGTLIVTVQFVAKSVTGIPNG